MRAITIITVSLNPGDAINSCLESVRSQNTEIQHIWIDGGSKDGTIDSLQSYSGHHLELVVEPDDGIYDAMNKGIDRANGDIIGILNADDCYADDDVLEKVLAVFDDASIDACYGDLRYVDANDPDRVVRFWRAGECTENSFYSGWMPPHPTLFVRRKIYEKYGLFNVALGTAADYELMLRLIVKNKISLAYIPRVLVHMRVGGASNATLRTRIKAHTMDYKAWRINGLWPYPWTLPLKPLRKIGQWFFK